MMAKKARTLTEYVGQHVITEAKISERLQGILDGMLQQAVLNRVQAAMNQASSLVVRDAKANLAPVTKTGALRDSIKQLSVRRGTKGVLTYVGSELPYSALIEYGDGAYAHKKYGPNWSGNPRKFTPYMRPALDSNEAAIKKLINDALGEAVRDVD